MSFPEKPTTEDLSGLPEAKGFPSYYSSMAGGNMVTKKNPHFAGQGSDTEATHDVVSGGVDWVGSAQSAETLDDEPRTPESNLDTGEKGSGYTPHPLQWKDL